MQGRREVAAALAVTLAVLAGFAGLGSGGWPGEPSGCIAAGDCYCEAFSGGRVEQPAATFSNFGFVIVGLWVLGSAGRTGAGGSLIRHDPRIIRLYGWITIGLGVGSMLFHAAMTEWGGWADLVSMYAFIIFFLLYEARAVGNRSPEWLMRTWALATVGLAGVQWFISNGHGKFALAALIVAAFACNRLVVTGRTASPPVIRNERWLWTGLGVYAAGNVIWMLSRTGAVLCAPESILQGHALWHLTAAAAVAAFYRYLQSETPRPVSSAGSAPQRGGPRVT